MKRIIIIMVIMVILAGIKPVNSYAYDRLNRDSIIQNARIVSNLTNTYNVITTVIIAGPTQIVSNSTSLPAYQDINNIIAQIQALKLSLKSFNP